MKRPGITWCRWRRRRPKLDGVSSRVACSSSKWIGRVRRSRVSKWLNTTGATPAKCHQWFRGRQWTPLLSLWSRWSPSISQMTSPPNMTALLNTCRKTPISVIIYRHLVGNSLPPNPTWATTTWRKPTTRKTRQARNNQNSTTKPSSK